MSHTASCWQAGVQFFKIKILFHFLKINSQKVSKEEHFLADGQRGFIMNWSLGVFQDRARKGGVKRALQGRILRRIAEGNGEFR
jgi:hypothetical protein